jgi:hypothetical protein
MAKDAIDAIPLPVIGVGAGGDQPGPNSVVVDRQRIARFLDFSQTVRFCFALARSKDSV